MKWVPFFIASAAVLPVGAAAIEPEPREVGVEASIAFPGHGGVRNFRADDDRGVWIEDQRRNWYYASFLGNCRDIRWSNAIGIDTRGSARLDKHARILVGDDSCVIATLVTADKPFPLSEQRRDRKAAEAAIKAETLN